MMSFAIMLYGQYCRLHVVGQQVISDIRVIRCCWSICSPCCRSICSLCFDSNNTNLVTDVLGMSVLLQAPDIACPAGYIMAVCTWW